MKRALVLAAGGVTGAVYEVGVLRAIEERHGPLHQLFDVFIGVSAGATTAVAASSAIPTFFEPVSVRGRHLVDGNVGKVAHLDLAISRGVRRILVVSPLAPVENGAGPCVVPGEDGTCLSLSERGFWAIHNQAFRIENHVRLHLGIGKFLSETPGRRIGLIEPDPADATLFLANPMSLSARREILESAYAQAQAAIARQDLEAAFAA